MLERERVRERGREREAVGKKDISAS